MPTLIEDSKALRKAKAEAAQAQTRETWMNREGALAWLTQYRNARCLPKRGQFYTVQGSGYGNVPAVCATLYNRDGKYQLIDASEAADAAQRVKEIEREQPERRFNWAMKLLGTITLCDLEREEAIGCIGMDEEINELREKAESLEDIIDSLEKIEDVIRWHHLRCGCGGRCETCRVLSDKILPLVE